MNDTTSRNEDDDAFFLQKRRDERPTFNFFFDLSTTHIIAKLATSAMAADKEGTTVSNLFSETFIVW